MKNYFTNSKPNTKVSRPADRHHHLKETRVKMKNCLTFQRDAEASNRIGLKKKNNFSRSSCFKTRLFGKSAADVMLVGLLEKLVQHKLLDKHVDVKVNTAVLSVRSLKDSLLERWFNKNSSSNSAVIQIRKTLFFCNRLHQYLIVIVFN